MRTRSASTPLTTRTRVTQRFVDPCHPNLLTAPGHHSGAAATDFTGDGQSGRNDQHEAPGRDAPPYGRHHATHTASEPHIDHCERSTPSRDAPGCDDVTLFVDASGAPRAVLADLYAISRGDWGLGHAAVPDDSSVQIVTYRPSPGHGPTADRLSQLVNTEFGTPIVITALAGGIDPYSNFDITGNGRTYVDSSSGVPIVRVVYDYTNCNGRGVFVFGDDGRKITFPPAVMVYHELSHALRAATNTWQPDDEPPAEADENILRAMFGLCPRDINNHGGGCGAGDDCGGLANGGNPRDTAS